MALQAQAVTVSLEDLKKGKWRGCSVESGFRFGLTHKTGTVPFETLQSAFGPDSLGILVVEDLPPEFPQVRHEVLSYASYLGNLPTETLGRVFSLVVSVSHYPSSPSNAPLQRRLKMPRPST
jgi:hypothetical protein